MVLTESVICLLLSLCSLKHSVCSRILLLQQKLTQVFGEFCFTFYRDMLSEPQEKVNIVHIILAEYDFLHVESTTVSLMLVFSGHILLCPVCLILYVTLLHASGIKHFFFLVSNIFMLCSKPKLIWKIVPYKERRPYILGSEKFWIQRIYNF